MAKSVGDMILLIRDGGCELSLTFCLSNIFMAKYCSVPLCFTNMTLPNEPVPRVFNLSKSSKHVVLCGIEQPVSSERLRTFPSQCRGLIPLTCGGHSHFRKKSSLALARNSLTKTRRNTDLISTKDSQITFIRLKGQDHRGENVGSENYHTSTKGEK